ncbi:MAG: aminotransferase class III-fold pyridoxal phosphate-dependent enzyme [Steroidobacteraceae bacterium]
MPWSATSTPWSRRWQPNARNCRRDLSRLASVRSMRCMRSFPRSYAPRARTCIRAMPARARCHLLPGRVITHGHCHPAIVEAVRRQVESLDQVIFAPNSAHELAETLARIAGRVAAGPAAHFLFDSGSTSVEVALKMALGYCSSRQPASSRFLVLKHGYHGDTVGTHVAGARGVFTRAYEPLLFQVESLQFPAARRESVTPDALSKPAVHWTRPRCCSNCWCWARAACSCTPPPHFNACTKSAWLTTYCSSPMR